MARAPLSQEFPAVALEAWIDAAKKSLKGRDVSTLAKTGEDGIAVEALYVPGNKTCPALAPGNRNFLAMPRVDLPSIDAAIAQIALDVASGATGITLVLDDNNPQRFGIKIKNADDVKRLLAALPETSALLIEAGARTAELAPLFLQQRITLHPGFDPLGIAAASGEFKNIEKSFVPALELLEKHNHKGPSFLIDARRFHNAGASDAQELGYALANAADNLRFMMAAGESATAALDRHSLMIATDARQFAQIAKLRAMRLLWARFTEEIAGTPQALRMGAETAMRMLTAKDPHTNLIRNTLAAFAAINGGADAVTVLPFTAALGLPDAFARRLAQNTLTLLRDESHVAEVQDAARGSAYVEALTLQLAQAAWSVFQSVEKRGGLLKSLKEGRIQNEIATKREARAKTYCEQEKQIVGITAFTDPAPRDVNVLAKFLETKTSELALTLYRDAQALENAAKRSEAAA